MGAGQAVERPVGCASRDRQGASWGLEAVEPLKRLIVDRNSTTRRSELPARYRRSVCPVVDSRTPAPSGENRMEDRPARSSASQLAATDAACSVEGGAQNAVASNAVVSDTRLTTIDARVGGLSSNGERPTSNIEGACTVVSDTRLAVANDDGTFETTR